MRRTLRAYRNNPIAPDAAEELIRYTVQTKGDLRLEFTRSDGSEVTAFVTPEGVSKAKGGVVLVAKNFRDLKQAPMFRNAKERRSIDLSRIKSMGYVEPFDRKDAITSASGPYRFLHPDFLVEIEYKGEKYPSVGAAVEDLEEELPNDDGGAPVKLGIVTELLVKKFSVPALARMLLASGTRPIELDPAFGGVVGADWAVNINPILTEVRKERASTGTLDPAKPLSLRLSLGDIPNTAATSAEARGLERMVLSELGTALERGVAVKEPELASTEAPRIEIANIEDIEVGADLPFNALIYIRAVKNDRIPEQLATFPGKLGYYVVEMPPDYEEVRDAPRVAQWMAAHPGWSFALALPPAYTQRNRSERLRTEAFAANLIAAVRSADVYEPAMRRALTEMYSPEGNLIVPFDGTIVAMVKRATDTVVVIETEPSLPARHTAVSTPDDFRMSHQEAWLRGLAEKVPPRTALGSYVMVGQPPKLMAHEGLVIPKKRTPIQNLIGQPVSVGDEIILAGTPSDAGRHREERLNIDGLIELRQDLPITTAPVVATYIPFSQPLTTRQAIAELINSTFDEEAEAKRKDYFLLSAMSRNERQDYVEQIEASPEIQPNPVRMGNAATLALAETLMNEHGYDEEEADYAAEQVLPLPAATPYPVFYLLFLDRKNRKVYSSGEAGALPEQDRAAREAVIKASIDAGVDEKTIRNAMYDRFMSDLPLNPRRVERMLRPLRSEQSTAVFDVLLPAIESKKGDSVFRWMPIPKGYGKGTKDAVQDIRTAVGTLAAAAAVHGQAPGGRASTAMLRLHRGQAAGDTAMAFVPSLREASKTGQVAVRGMAASVSVPGEPSTDTTKQIYLAGAGTRLSAYLDQLVKKMPMKSASAEQLRRESGRLTRDYGTQAPPELRGRERGAWTREEKLTEGYEDPAEALRLEAKEAELVLADPASTELQRLSAQNTIQQYDKLTAIKGELERRKHAETQEKLRKQLRGKGAGSLSMFLFEFQRAPTEEEQLIMNKAKKLGEDPIEAVRAAMKPKKNTRRNPGPDDDIESLFVGFDEPATPDKKPEEAAAASTPATSTPKEETALVPALKLPASTPDKKTRLPVGGYQRAFFTPPPSLVETMPEAREVEAKRLAAGAAWGAFNESLRSSPRKSAEELRGLLAKYREAASALQETLDVRDRAIVAKEKSPTLGRQELERVLQAEARESMDLVQAAYTRPPADSKKKFNETTRRAIVRALGGMLDPMGRPYAPPSAEEMRAHHLDPRELTQDIQPSRFGLAAHALSYSDLMDAAKIAADATRKAQKGQAPSTISCRVMRSDQMARRLLNRELINRIMFFATYQMQKEVSGGPVDADRGFKKDKTAVIWISPDGTHAIFYVNGVGLCEFHSTSFKRLITDVLHYTQDWFNDPRTLGRSDQYSLWIGQSGTSPWNAKLYQVWGRWLGRREGAKKIVLLNEVPGNVMTSDISYARLKDLVNFLPNGEGLGEPKALPADLKPAMKGLVAHWISENTADTLRPGKTMADIQKEEADAYRSALTPFGARVSGAQEVLVGEVAGIRARQASAAMAKAMAAMEGKAFNITLFYPALYGRGGVLRTTNDDASNEQTGVQIEKQLDALAAHVPDGAHIRIFDASLFIKETIVSALQEPQLRGAASQKITGPLGRFVPATVPVPYAYLREKLKGRRVLLELVVQENAALLPLMEIAFAGRDGYPPVIPLPLPRGSMFELFNKSILEGSTVLLWNNPDIPNASEVFGARDGLTRMAEALAANLPYIKQVLVETEYQTKKVGGTKIEEPYVDPQDLRAEVLDVMMDRIKNAGRDVNLFKAALGIPESVYKAAKVSPTAEPEENAARVMNAIAEAYKVDPIRYFRPGGRRYNWTGVGPLDNRGQIPRHSAVRSRRR
jgi:hypothetical protein